MQGAPTLWGHSGFGEVPVLAPSNQDVTALVPYYQGVLAPDNQRFRLWLRAIERLRLWLRTVRGSGSGSGQTEVPALAPIYQGVSLNVSDY